MDVDRTILFADISDSTGMTETLGDVDAYAYIADILTELASITDAVGGSVIKTIGDEIMSSFESPLAGITAAMDMQRAVTARPPMKAIRPRIRVGLHGGPVLLEDGDVYGDVVNVAARVAGLAAADQILTTGETIERVGETDASIPYRSLGVHGVQGRDERLTLCEVIWRDEGTQMTILAPRLDLGKSPELAISLGEQALSLAGDSTESMLLGRGTECSLVVPSTSASRAHAAVQSRGGLFYLKDHSTNGTYIRPEGANEIFVHRDQVLLQGSGVIRLGEPISEPGPLDIAYRIGFPE